MKTPSWKSPNPLPKTLRGLYLHSLYGDAFEARLIGEISAHSRKVEVKAINLPGRNGERLANPLDYIFYDTLAEYILKQVDITNYDLLIGYGWGGGVAAAISATNGIPVILIEMAASVTFLDLARARPPDYRIGNLTPDLEMLIDEFVKHPDSIDSLMSAQRWIQIARARQE